MESCLIKFKSQYSRAIALPPLGGSWKGVLTARDEAYYEAEKKIQEALKSGATELDLSREFDAEDEEKLTELPESLGQLTQSTERDLSNNQLIAVS